MNALTKKSFQWLINFTLVFCLFSFSGQISEVKSYNTEPVRTELKAANRVSVKRTARFKSNYQAAGFTPSKSASNQTTNFTASLAAYENHVELKLKANLVEISIRQGQRNKFVKYSHPQSYAVSDSDIHEG